MTLFEPQGTVLLDGCRFIGKLATIWQFSLLRKRVRKEFCFLQSSCC